VRWRSNAFNPSPVAQFRTAKRHERPDRSERRRHWHPRHALPCPVGRPTGHLDGKLGRLARAADATGLKSAMEKRFPDLGMGVALDIGSKVAKGEMKWG